MTKELSQHYLVTLALYLVGGEDKFVDTEDVAVKSYEIAPGRFGWRKYPQFPNLELVRVFLSDAKKPDKGHLVSGSGRKGWTLTPDGLRWVRDSGLSFLEGNSLDQPGAERAGSIDSVRKSRELKRIRSTDAWQAWSTKSAQISLSKAKQVFRIDSYSKGEMLQLKIDRLRKTFIDDPEISDFLRESGDMILEGDKQ